MGQIASQVTHTKAAGDIDHHALHFSVIIPSLNESAKIEAALGSVRSSIVPPLEVLVVDGGSTDDTAEKARKLGAKVIPSARGRGCQLNAGWRAARGEWCLFLHSDSILPPGYDRRIAEALHHRTGVAAAWAPSTVKAAPTAAASAASLGPLAGASVSATVRSPAWAARHAPLRLPDPRGACGRVEAAVGPAGGTVDHPALPLARFGSACVGGQGPRPWAVASGSQPASQAKAVAEGPVWGSFATILTDLQNPILHMVLYTTVELRTRLLHKPYGDQALFVRRDILEACGGFKEWQLLEDLEMVSRLGQRWQPVIVDAPVRTSGRRWQTKGFWRTTFLNQAILVAYALGVPPDALAEWYRGKPGVAGGPNKDT